MYERNKNARDIEVYAQACWEILLGLGIQDGHCKMYDPMTIQDNTAHSYVFDLKDGGRHHSFSDLEELKNDVLSETVEQIKNLLTNEEEKE